jgi:quercetin dioxygenase-like cupin family protein
VEVLALDGSRKRIIWNHYVRGGYSSWPVGQECVVHGHLDAVEVFVLLDGQCEMTVGQEVELVGAGQTVYVGPEAWHKLKAVGERPLVMFWAVMPNHSPNHTFLKPDGSFSYEDTPGPPLEDASVVR